MQLLLLYLPVPSHSHSAHEVPSDGVEIGSSLSVIPIPDHPSRHILYREPGTAGHQLKNRSRPGLPAPHYYAVCLVLSRLVSSTVLCILRQPPATACLRVPDKTPPRLSSTLPVRCLTFAHTYLRLSQPLPFASLHLNLFINTPGRLSTCL